MNRLASAARDGVFLSYSHDDQDWRRKFMQMLVPLVRNRGLELWDDTHIPVGDDWRRNIDDGVRRAGAALLLVTDSYLASRFIMEEELPALIAHGVRLVPVLVEDCLWDCEPLLASVQWAHDPGRDGPLAAADPREVNGRIVRICRKLLESAPAAGQPPRAAGPAWAGGVPDAVAALPPGPDGPLHEVPTLPAEYLERDELDGLRAALLGAGTGAVGVTGQVPAVGLHGQGGIGKTVLAAAAARDPVVRAYFPDGVFWVTVGEQPDLAGLQGALLSRLGAVGTAPRSATDGAGLLRQALAGRQVLLVIDDVWSAAAAQAFRVTGPRGRVLYTTRDPAVLAAVRAAAEPVGVLSESAARQLLASITGLPASALPTGEVARVLAATGRVALAVALVGAAVRSGASWPQVVGELDRGGDTFLDHPYANTFKALQVATTALDPGLAVAYTSLAVYPPDIRVPVAAVARYWGQLRGSSSGQVRTDLQTLADRELLILDGDEIAFHDLQHSYLLLQADDLALLHADLLAGYQALLPAAGTGWWRLPAGEPYIWDHLLYHLHGARDRAGAVSTLTDLAYLARRIALAGPHAAETDLTQASLVLPDDPRIGWLRRWLAKHGHLFAGLADQADVAVTLAGWLVGPPAGIDRHRLDPLLPSRYLTPRWGLPETPALHRVLTGHTARVEAVAIAPDGTWLATADQTGSVRIWDTATGQQRAALTGHTISVSAVAIAPDGTWLATAGRDRSVRIWDVATEQQRAILTGHTAQVETVAIAPDGSWLATGSVDGTARIWDVATEQQRATLTGHSFAVSAVAIAPDGSWLATAGVDGTARIWDVATGQQRAALTDQTFTDLTLPVSAVAIAPDGTWLATVDLSVRIWDVATGQQRATLTDQAGPVLAVAIASDGTWLATAGVDGSVRIWDAATWQQRATFIGHTIPVLAVAIAPDGTWLATADKDGAVRIWDAATRRAGAMSADQAPNQTAIAFAPDGTWLATVGADGLVRIWDVVTGRQRPALTGRTGPVRAVAIAPDGTWLATGNKDRSVRIWDAATWQQRAALTGHTGPVRAVAISPDGTWLATADRDGSVRIWDAATWQQRAALAGPVGRVAISPDGTWLATADRDGSVRIWDAATWQQRAALAGPVGAVAIAPDGTWLATADRDGFVRIWDAATWQQRAALAGPVGAVAITPDGTWLATASVDGTVRIWDMVTKDITAVMRVDGALFDCAWSPSGQSLAAAGYAGLYYFTFKS